MYPNVFEIILSILAIVVDIPVNATNALIMKMQKATKYLYSSMKSALTFYENEKKIKSVEARSS